MTDFPSTQRAAVLHKAHELRLEPEWPAPTELGPNDALVRITRVGICGSGELRAIRLLVAGGLLC